MNRLCPVAAGRGDAGHASVFLILLIPVITVVFALVWEAGQMLVARSELMSTAHSAARAGAHEIDTTLAVEHGEAVLDPQAAERAATDHLHHAGVPGRVEAQDGQVIVRARTTYTPAVLPIGPRQIEAEAEAAALQP